MALELCLEQLAHPLAVLALQRLGVERRGERRDDLLRELELRPLHLGAGHSLVDLRVVLHVVVDEERLERERVPHRPDQAELLLAGEHEAAERGDVRLLHRLVQQHVGTACGFRAGGYEVVRPVEVDGIDVGELHEAADLDRAARVVLLDRLEVGVLDGHVLPLRHLPPAHELVGFDDPLVNRAVALLLDRRPAFAVQQPERHVRLAGGRLRSGREADRDVDEAEADVAVPGCTHVLPEVYVGQPVFALASRVPADMF